jgi:flagellar motor switch protein FliN/FliY
MASNNENSVDDLLAQIQSDTDAIKSTAAAGISDAAADAATAALDQVAGSMNEVAANLNEIAGEMEAPAPRTAAPLDAVSDVPSFAAPSRIAPHGATDIRRLLAIEVPVIVQLGMRRLTVNEVMRLAVGAIVEFGKSAEEELDLLVNNKAVGKGHAVKVGENFGIKITTMDSVKETIRKLGAI